MLADLRSALFRLPAIPARELKVWVYQITAEGNSEALPAKPEVGCGAERRHRDLNLAAGSALVAIDGAPSQVQITLVGPGRGR